MNHFPLLSGDAMSSWGNTGWTQYSEASPNAADEDLNLNFLFDSLDPGASVSFTWVYILRVEDLLTAMGQVCVCVCVCLSGAWSVLVST